MILRKLSILNYKNIREADLTFSDKLNCFIGLNGQGKTNIMDAIYLLSFTKSAFNIVDSQNITHDADMALVQGHYQPSTVNCQPSTVQVSCGLKRGVKKQFRLDKTDYKRLIDHIGLIPLVMVCPEDSELIAEGSDERRRFLNVVISQQDKTYIEYLTSYNALLKQRNALLKQLADRADEREDGDGLLAVYEQQMAPLAQAVYNVRKEFIEAFIPVFQSVYAEIAEDAEQVSLRYISQLQNRDLKEAYVATRQRDMILGWTSQGVHKDELEMTLGGFPIKREGSQGQNKTYAISMKLAQFDFLRKTISSTTPLLLLDDIFDKLDASRVEKIVNLVAGDSFGQIFITDTNRDHLDQILKDRDFDYKLFKVKGGEISPS